MKKSRIEIIQKLVAFFPVAQEKVGPAYRHVEKNNPILNKNQIGALMLIGRREEMTHTQIGCALNMKKGGVTTLVDGLVEKNMVKRCNDPDDRRKVWIRLTKEGTAHRQALKDQLYLELEKIFANISDERMEKFDESLEYVFETLREFT